jgi:dTDP-4-amino-4,6-dideoxygalactose transaminase
MKSGKFHPLAILGNQPAFPQPIRVGYPNIGNRKRLFKRVEKILDRSWLTNWGPYVREFEEKIADITGVKHCIAVCNATIGLQIAAQVLDISGEVIVPAFTFIATPHALEWQRITPIFCDIDPSTHNIDPQKIEPLITPRTSGILGVHLWGRACQIDPIQDIANRHQLRLFFDAAHAFRSSYQRNMIGNFGDLEVFSFHATKFINTLEGGVIATNDDNIARTAQSIRNFGFEDNDFSSRVGINAKMNEMSAAMGLTLLDDLNELIERNYTNYRIYQSEIQVIPGISLLNFDKSEHNNYQYIIIEVDENITQVSRDQLMTILSFENIYARRYFHPGCHLMEPYKSRDSQVSLPFTDLVANRVLALPTGETVTIEMVRQICYVIQSIIHQREKVKEKLKKFTDLRDEGQNPKIELGQYPQYLE